MRPVKTLPALALSTTVAVAAAYSSGYGQALRDALNGGVAARDALPNPFARIVRLALSARVARR